MLVLLESWALGNGLRCFQCSYFSIQQELKTGDVTSVFNNFSLDFVVWLDSPTSESRRVISKALRIHHEPLGTQVSEELQPQPLCSPGRVSQEDTDLWPVVSVRQRSTVTLCPAPGPCPFCSGCLACLWKDIRLLTAPDIAMDILEVGAGWLGTGRAQRQEPGAWTLRGQTGEGHPQGHQRAGWRGSHGAEAVGHGHHSPLPRVFPPKQLKAPSAGSLEPWLSAPLPSASHYQLSLLRVCITT